MKKFVRTPWVQSVLAWLVSQWLEFTLATMRWRFEQREIVDAMAASPEGAIACFWHGQIALGVACRKVIGKKPRRVLISRSHDGEFITKVVARLHIPAIRGSAMRRDAARATGGYAASRDVLRFLKSGGLMVITPDGPVGPAQKVAVGPVMLARIAGAPIILAGLAARPALTLKSWDRMQLPLPFGRAHVVFDGPVRVPHDITVEDLEGARAELETRLRAAQARAEATLAAA